MPKKTLLQRWKEEGLAPQLAELMQSAVFQRAMEIIREHTEPNDLVVRTIYQRNPEFAEKQVASIHQMQAGERRVIRMLQTLSEHMDMPNGQIPEPFAHVNETYFETRNS